MKRLDEGKRREKHNVNLRKLFVSLLFLTFIIFSIFFCILSYLSFCPFFLSWVFRCPVQPVLFYYSFYRLGHRDSQRKDRKIWKTEIMTGPKPTLQISELCEDLCRFRAEPSHDVLVSFRSSSFLSFEGHKERTSWQKGSGLICLSLFNLFIFVPIFLFLHSCTLSFVIFYFILLSQRSHHHISDYVYASQIGEVFASSQT